jgi:hypothetical protein
LFLIFRRIECGVVLLNMVDIDVKPFITVTRVAFGLCVTRRLGIFFSTLKLLTELLIIYLKIEVKALIINTCRWTISWCDILVQHRACKLNPQTFFTMGRR